MPDLLLRIAFRHADNDAANHGNLWCRFCDWLILRTAPPFAAPAPSKEGETTDGD